MKLKITLNLLLLSVNAITLLGQKTLRIESYGNAYGWEIGVAQNACNCIINGCFDGLKRTQFIDNNTGLDEQGIIQKLATMRREGYQLDVGAISIVYDPNLPDLSFFTTYRSRDSVFFQIRLDLEYRSGLLMAKSIKLLEKDFILSKTDSGLIYEVERPSGSRTNIPLPPHPSSIDIIYRTRGVNFCPDCFGKKVISQKPDFKVMLYEKYSYDYIKQLEDDVFLVKKTGQWGVVTGENKNIIPVIFDTITLIDGDWYKVFKNKKIGMYIKDSLFLPVVYERIDCFVTNQGVELCIGKDSLVGIINKNKEVVIPMEYEEIRLFYSKYLRLKKNGLYGIANATGEIFCNPVFKEINFEDFEFNGIMKGTDKKGRKKVFVLLNEDGESTVKRVRN